MVSPTPSNPPPGEHPDPPTTLDPKNLSIFTSTGPWYRLNPVRYPSALYFDRSGCGRFDGPGQGYGILYLGEDGHTCFIESFGRNGLCAVAEIELQQRNLFMINSTRPLNIVDLSGAGLIKMGADGRLTTGSYEQSRKWVQAIWKAGGMQVDGIRYRSRRDNNRYCYGLFDRVHSELNEQNLGNLVDSHPQALVQILDDYGFVLL